MDSTRRIAFVAGGLFGITFLTSIPAQLALYTPVLDHPNCFVGAVADAGTGVSLGELLELILIIANVDTALALFPILKGRTKGSFVTVGKSLVAIHDWTFLLGPGFVVGAGNGLILGSLMYRSGLVPRGMALLGLIGGPVLCAAGIAVLFDVFEPGSAPQVIATAPEFVWELSLGVYLMVKGFKPSPILSGNTGAAGVGASSSPA